MWRERDLTWHEDKILLQVNFSFVISLLTYLCTWCRATHTCYFLDCPQFWFHQRNAHPGLESQSWRATTQAKSHVATSYLVCPCHSFFSLVKTYQNACFCVLNYFCTLFLILNIPLDCLIHSFIFHSSALHYYYYQPCQIKTDDQHVMLLLLHAK